MTGRARLTVVLLCGVVVLLTAWYAGSRFPPTQPAPPVGAIRLGPDPGESVPGYLARLPAELPPGGAVAPALVQLAAEQTLDEALAATAGAAPLTAVFHVALPRVQTALRFEPLDAGVPASVAAHTARERARLAAAADADRLVGRPRDVAAAEAAALTDPGCRCALALLVQADRAGLTSIATRPGVRAVHAAPPGAAARELAIAPLLPDQIERADPLPDDGPVPPA